MTLKRAALHSVFGVLAAATLASAALAADQSSGQSQQTATPMKRQMNQLLWLKPTAGQPACPAGTALAVTTNAAGRHMGKPKCMPKTGAGGSEQR